jgi:fucose permease
MPLFNKKKNEEVVVEDVKYEEERGAVKRPSYLLPGVLVTILFFLWGFSYGLLDTLNKHFRNVLGICK